MKCKHICKATCHSAVLTKIIQNVKLFEKYLIFPKTYFYFDNRKKEKDPGTYNC